MAQKKKKTATTRASSGYARAWRRPSVKLLHLIVFAAVFMWLGHYLFPGHAEGPVPTAGDQIVAYYDTLGDWQSQQQADGSVTNLLPPGDIIVAGDGSLYCNTAGDGVVRKSNIGLGVVKQIFDALNANDVHNAVDSQKTQGVDYSVATPADGTITVYSNADDWALSSVGDTTGVFARSASLLQHKCQAGNNATVVTQLPAFTNATADVSDAATVSWASKSLFSPAAALSSTYNSSETGTMNSNVNNYRVNHGVPALNGNSCLFSFTNSSGVAYGASPWTKHMASVHSLSHDPNLGYVVNHCSSNKWTAYGQNVGMGNSVSAIWNAYLNSSEHKANILSKSYTKWGDAVYDDSAATRWNTMNFAKW